MIRSFRSRALKDFWETGDTSKLHGSAARIRRVLSELDAARRPEDLNAPGFRFHPLVRRRTGTYSIRVTANRRITFQWNGEDAVAMDFEDYH